MGQNSSKESVTLTSHKTAEESVPNGKDNQTGHETTDQPQAINEAPQESNDDYTTDHTNKSQNHSSQKVSFTVENNEDGKVEMKNGESITAAPEKADLLKKRTSFYETVDASEILPYLIVGNNASSMNRDFLSRKNIHFILSLTSEPIESQIEGIEYKTVILEDDDEEMLQPHFETCFKFIDKAKGAPRTPKTKRSKRRKSEEESGAVLVHSFFGISRTAAIVLAYLMKERNWTLKEAYTHLKEKHPSANPNDNFIVQLLHYEQELHDGKRTMTLKDFYH